jgi:hypothetical protein
MIKENIFMNFCEIIMHFYGFLWNWCKKGKMGIKKKYGAKLGYDNGITKQHSCLVACISISIMNMKSYSRVNIQPSIICKQSQLINIAHNII